VRVPTIASDGSVVISSVNELKTEEVFAWVRARLQGKDTRVSADNRGDDAPHYLIALLYPLLERQTRFDIESAALTFMKELADNKDSEWLGESGEELLMLVDPVLLNSDQRDGAIDVLLLLASRMRPNAKPNLHLKSLQGLVAMKHRISREFWEEQFRRGGDTCSATVLGGLALVSLSDVIDWIGHVPWSERLEEAVVGFLPFLLEEYRVARVTDILEESLPSFPRRTAEAIVRFLSEEAIPIKVRVKDRIGAMVPSKTVERDPRAAWSNYSGLEAGELARISIDSTNVAASEEFIRRFQPFILQVVSRAAKNWTKVSRQVEEDLVQDTFLRLFQDDSRLLRNFQPIHENSIYAFIKSVAQNVVRESFRSSNAARRGAAVTESFPLPETEATEWGSLDALELHALSREVYDTLVRVSSGPDQDRRRLIFWLYYREGLTAKEIAVLPSLRISAKGVEGVIRRLSGQIRQALSEKRIKNKRQ
jgi:RNA polymerase sigma-70 factor (ECF subfamily)